MSYGNEIDRRAFLKFAGTAITAAALPGTLYGKTVEPHEKSLSFYNIHTGESLRTTYWAEGDYIPDSLAEIDKILRDFRSGTETVMDPKVLDILFAVRTKLESTKPFQIISGYRSPQTNAMLRKNTTGVAKKSLHMQGKAIDLNLPGTDLAILRKAALSERAGGVGYYPASNFVHVDSGRVRHW